MSAKASVNIIYMLGITYKHKYMVMKSYRIVSNQIPEIIVKSVRKLYDYSWLTELNKSSYPWSHLINLAE